jgi:hypothetical protein
MLSDCQVSATRRGFNDRGGNATLAVTTALSEWQSLAASSTMRSMAADTAITNSTVSGKFGGGIVNSGTPAGTRDAYWQRR